MILDKSQLKKTVNKVYREPIKIQKLGKPTQRHDGMWTTGQWEDWKKVFANVKNLHGAEYFQAGQLNKQETVKFYIRFMNGISNEVKEEFRIIYRDKIYNIDFIDNINYLNEELEIKAEERVITDGSR